MNSGKPELLRPGWHFVPNPLNSLSKILELSNNLIVLGPVVIMRITEGSIGFAMNNTENEILLPGTHCRNNGTFKFSKLVPLNNDRVEHRQIKLLTVLTGNVQICYDMGKATILKPGKYAINSPNFVIGPLVSVQQESLKFTKHTVLLDGGIQMNIEGLLTFQIEDVEKMLRNLGLGEDNKKLTSSIEKVAKAEISKVFSAIFLDQISSISDEEALNPQRRDSFEKNVKEEGLKVAKEYNNSIRIKICHQIMILVRPLLESWGVKVVNFQLESIKLTDKKFALSYEAASLEIAKSKANLKANIAKNEINIALAIMEAKALLIKTEGEKKAKIVVAEGLAKAMTIEAKARNDAALMLNDDFSKELMMVQEKVNFAKVFKATTLIINDKNMKNQI